MITASGFQFRDWSSAYRLFNKSRIDINQLFSVLRKTLIGEHLQNNTSIHSHMDDSCTRKKGKKVAGTSWMRDPLGPPFHTNFIWGQRYVQVSISLPEDQQVVCGPSRAIPVDFYHCPKVKKPKKTDEASLWKAYKEKQKQLKLSQVGCERITKLRGDLDQEGFKCKHLIISVDGSYTNETVLKNLPERTTLIGRTRKDSVLHHLPDTSQKGVGRNRVYGEQIPTPEDIRKNDNYPWQQVEAWACGKTHQFNVKVIKNLRWRKAGNQDLQLVIIKPLSYRLTKHSKLLYRQPAYLICTNPNLAIEELLQAYLRRWDIEVNFKEEKTNLGCGKAQVRTLAAIESLPAYKVFVYGLLLLANHRIKTANTDNQLPRSKWYPKKSTQRTTTGDMLNVFRSQIWAMHSSANFSHFINSQHHDMKHKKLINPTFSAAFYRRI